MTGSDGDRYVVRLACGHETLEVVPPGSPATPVGERFTCRECRREQRIIESFQVEP